MKLLDLKGKTAVVFGGSGYLGSYIAAKLFEHGAKVAINYFENKEKAERQVKEMGNERAMAVYGDVTDETSCSDLVKQVKNKFGSIDFAINTVHMPFDPKNVVDMTYDDWRVHLEAQKGHFIVCKSVIPAMQEQQYGRIIYISGALAIRYIGRCSAFAAVKRGLEGFNRTLAMEEGKNNITVNIVSPGKISDSTTAKKEDWDVISSDLLKRTPMGKFATPDDVANAVLYFVSPLASGITGQILYVANGEIML